MCNACGGERYLVVSVDGNPDNLRIERCDACSWNKLEDRDVQAWPAAKRALREAQAARQKAKPGWCANDHASIDEIIPKCEGHNR